MIVETLSVGPLETNCYLVGCPETRAGMLIDPGGDAELIIERARALRLTPEWVMLTHGHGDHIGAVPRIMKTFPDARLAVHEADAASLTDPRLNLSMAFGIPVRAPAADLLLHDGDEVALGRLRFRVIHVPGHTPGGIALFLPARAGGDGPVLFSGDSLFRESVGRGDLPGGDFLLLIRSIRERLLTLPEETRVYPGHGGPTTIGHEKRANPYLR
jgi:glyoxylase-like metal-dependent hydrolase (beta-lactamase superfamily II)